MINQVNHDISHMNFLPHLSKSKENNGMHGHDYDYYFTKSRIMENRIILAWKVKVNSHHFFMYSWPSKRVAKNTISFAQKTKALSAEFLLYILGHYALRSIHSIWTLICAFHNIVSKHLSYIFPIRLPNTLNPTKKQCT